MDTSWSRSILISIAVGILASSVCSLPAQAAGRNEIHRMLQTQQMYQSQGQPEGVSKIAGAAAYQYLSQVDQISASELLDLCQIFQNANRTESLAVAMEALLRRLGSDASFQDALPSALAPVAAKISHAPNSEGNKVIRAYCKVRASQAQPLTEWIALDALAQSVGDEEQSAKIAKSITAASMQGGQFLATLAPSEIVALSKYYERRNEQTARAALGQFLVDVYFQQDGLPQALQGKEWMDLLSIVAETGSDSLKQEALDVFLNSLETPMFSLANRRSLRGALEMVTRLGGDETQVQQLFQAWLSVPMPASEELQQRALKVIAGKTDLSDFLVFAKQQLDAAGLSESDVTLVARLLLGHGTSEQRQEWFQFALDMPESTAKATFVARQLAQPGGGEFSQIQTLAAIDAIAEQDDALALPDDVWRGAGRRLYRMRDELNSRLVSADGMPNLAVLRLAAWAYKAADSDRYYYNRLSRRTENAATDAARVRWHLAQAYVAGLLHSKTTDRLDGKGHLDQALALATEPQEQLLCLRMFAELGIEAGRAKLPLAIVESLQLQVEDQSVQAAIQQLAGDLKVHAAQDRMRSRNDAIRVGWRRKWTARGEAETIQQTSSQDANSSSNAS